MASEHRLLVIVALAVGCHKIDAAPPMPTATPDRPTPDPHAFLDTTSAPREAVRPPRAELATASPRATRSASGLYSEVLRPSSSRERPTRDDIVVMTMDAWDADGTLVESYTTSDAFSLRNGMPGMIEGLTTMSKGEKRRLWISTPLQGTYALAPGSIVCDIELVDIVHPNAAP